MCARRQFTSWNGERNTTNDSLGSDRDWVCPSNFGNVLATLYARAHQGQSWTFVSQVTFYQGEQTMSYESISIHISGDNPEKKKSEIKEEAIRHGKSVSQFLLECYELVTSARKKKTDKVGVTR